MTFTDPTPNRVGTTSVKRLAAVEQGISARCGVTIHPAELERVLTFFAVPVTVGRGQPHRLYSTRAIATADYERLMATPKAGLLEAMGREL